MFSADILLARWKHHLAQLGAQSQDPGRGRRGAHARYGRAAARIRRAADAAGNAKDTRH